jgi:hypothetical protein
MLTKAHTQELALLGTQGSAWFRQMSRSARPSDHDVLKQGAQRRDHAGVVDP